MMQARQREGQWGTRQTTVLSNMSIFYCFLKLLVILANLCITSICTDLDRKRPSDVGSIICQMEQTKSRSTFRGRGIKVPSSYSFG